MDILSHPTHRRAHPVRLLMHRAEMRGLPRTRASRRSTHVSEPWRSHAGQLPRCVEAGPSLT